MQPGVKQETERLISDRQRSESANPAVQYHDVRVVEDVAEDLSRPLSSSYPHYRRPSARTSGIVGTPSARVSEEIALPMKLPPPAHSHHRRTDAPTDHILVVDNSMQQHRSPGRNMPSPRGYGGDHILPDDVARPARRTVPPPLPYLPPTPSTATSAGRAVPKFSAVTSGPPPLIHELVKGVSGGGSIVLGTPLSPEQRRRHFELPPAVGMLYKGTNDPSMLRSGFAGGPVMAPQPPPPTQEGQFPIVARQTVAPWPPPSHIPQQSVIHATGDANVATNSRDLLYGDLLTARQMHRGQVAAAPTEASADHRRTSPRSAAGSYALPSWQHVSRGGHQYMDDMHRADIVHTMTPWPVRPPPASMTRYSVCGEPSRQCYTPPLPIQKAFISRDPGSDRPSRHDSVDAPLPSRLTDPSRVGSKISPQYKDVAENISDWRHIDIRRLPNPDVLRETLPAGSHRNENQSATQAPAVTTSSDKLTAANLIDAIIIEQINHDPRPITPTQKLQGLSPGRATAGTSGGRILDRLGTTDTATKEQSSVPTSAPVMLRSPPAASDQQQQTVEAPVGVMSPPGDGGPSAKRKLTMTFGEHIDLIIMNDFKEKDGDPTDSLAFDSSTSVGKISR